MTKNFLTVNDLIDVLKVSKLTIYRYIKSGKLPAYKVGRDFRIEEEEFNKFIEYNKVKKQKN